MSMRLIRSSHVEDRVDFRSKLTDWVNKVRGAAPGSFRSHTDGDVALSSTCYGMQLLHFLAYKLPIEERQQIAEYIQSWQDPQSGFYVGPEFLDWSPPPSAMHDREHLLHHLTCAAIPVLLELGMHIKYPLRFAHKYVDSRYLEEWLSQRRMNKAWFEGNNLLFVGQLLIYLRDVEKVSGSDEALARWFNYHDRTTDPRTGLWGSDVGASNEEAVFGGYHQLLVYYHENRPLKYPHQIVDTVLALQHPDGGFSSNSGGGACEDVDCVDILVNLYKLQDYRRPAIRLALRRCLQHLLSIQNPDGGFPYNSQRAYIHMGIPATRTGKGQSGMFSTWFRVHTLALISQILTDEPAIAAFPWRFSSHLSMGWHRAWNTDDHQLTEDDRRAEDRYRLRMNASIAKRKMYLASHKAASACYGMLRRVFL